MRIGSIIGIDIELHFTFLLLMAFVALFGGQYFVFILLLFLFVFIHELSHSLVAKARGGRIKSITLLPIGGVANMEEPPGTPRGEFLMALAGPGINFLIGALALLLLYHMGKTEMVYSVFTGEFSFGAAGFLAMAAYINLLLGGFNLLVPALPMDGGRVLRSLLAMRMDSLKATEISTRIAKVLAALMFVIGVAANFWLVIISLFVYIGATQEAEMAKITTFLTGITVGDIMSRDVKTVPSGMDLQGFSDTILRYKHMGYPVVDGGRMVGIATFNDLARVPREDWDRKTVGDVMTRDVLTVHPGDDVIEVFQKIITRDIGRVPVVDGGVLVGIVSKTDIMRVIQVLGLKFERRDVS